MITPMALGVIKRELMSYGIDYLFKRPSTDNNNEVIPNEYDTEFTVRGILHVASSPITVTTEAAGKITNKKIPKVFSLWEDSQDIALGDIVEIGGNVFRVNGVENIGLLNTVGDINIEVIVHGF